MPAVRILKNRLVFDGTIGITGCQAKRRRVPHHAQHLLQPRHPTSSRVYNTSLHADSAEESAPGNNYDVAAPAPPSAAFVNGSQFLESPLPRIGGGARVSRMVATTSPSNLRLGRSEHEADRLATGGTVDVKVPFDPSARRLPVERAKRGGLAAAGDGHQPLRGERSPGLHRRPIRRRDPQRGRLPGRLEDRHGRDRHPGAA